MKINTDEEIKNLEDVVIKDESGKNVTLKTCAVAALINPSQEDVKTADEKIANFSLAVKLQKGGVQDLKAEEIVKMKDAIGKYFGVLIVGRCLEILDK